MNPITEIPTSTTDLLTDLNDRLQAISENFLDLTQKSGTPSAPRTYDGTPAPQSAYSYINPVVNVFDYLDPLYARLRTAAMQVREVQLMPNSVGQNQLQIDSVIARHIVAGTITADKISVNELSAIVGNIGTITAGNITLDTSGFIRGGATDYTTGTGFWMGYSGGAYKFFMGAHGGDYIQWDGTNLSLSGSATIVGSVDWTTGITNRPMDNTGKIITATSAGATSGLYLGSDKVGFFDGAAWKTYWDSSGNFYLGGTSGNLQWNGTTLTITGAITLTNTISYTSVTGLAATATSSDFASITGATKPSNNATVGAAWGTNLTGRPTELTDGRITTAINATGELELAVAASPSGSGLFLGSDKLGFYGSGAWKTYMDNTGNFYLGGTSGSLTWNGTTLTIAGTITATAGSIGGFNLGADYIRDAADSFGLASTVTGGDDVRFWAGAAFASRATAPFRITEAGVVTATSGTFSGNIDIGTGTSRVQITPSTFLLGEIDTANWLSVTTSSSLIIKYRDGGISRNVLGLYGATSASGNSTVQVLRGDNSRLAELSTTLFGVDKVGIQLGTSTPDVNLYRDAADVLKTDDSFIVSGTVSPLGLLDISGASAGQIKFPATQNASANANTLDDYEEGTFSPTVGGTSTYTTQEGVYTKIGRVVYFKIRMTINSLGTGSTHIISGLPFTASATASPISVGYFANLATSVIALYSFVEAGSSSIYFSMSAASGTGATINPAIFGNSADVLLAGSYSV